MSTRDVKSRPVWIGQSRENGRSLEGRVVRSRRRRERFNRARDFDGMYPLDGASNDGRGSSDRRRRQHKRHRGDHRLVRILTTGHRAVHHPAHIVAIMAAFFSSCGTVGSLLVMVLWNIAKVFGTARHGATRPGGSRERHIKKVDGQQAHERGENSAAIWGAAVHRLHSRYVGIICPIDSGGTAKIVVGL